MFPRWRSIVGAAVSTLIAMLAVPGGAMAQQNSTVFPWQAGYSGQASRMSTYYGPNYATAPVTNNLGPAPLTAGYFTPSVPAGAYIAPYTPAMQQSMYPPDLGYVSAAPGGANATRATLVGHVPANARVWIEGQPTTSNGPLRRYTSPALTPGASYRYTVRVEWSQAGKTVSQTESVPVRAGGTSDFYIGTTR